MQVKWALFLVASSLFEQTILAQTKDRPGDWPRYGRDLSSTRYSPLEQITTKNVDKLRVAWNYQLRTEAERNRPGRGGGIGGYSQVTPIVVNGVMYITAGNR